MSEQNKILIGKIVAPQGLRGEVRVQTYTASPTDFQKFKVQSSKFKSDDFKFVRVVPSSDVIIAKINGFDDRNAAESLRGVELFVERGDLPPLSSDEYYQTDLLGFNVVRGDIILGQIAAFQNFGAGDIIELRNGDMISFNGATVDAQSKTVYVK